MKSHIAVLFLAILLLACSQSHTHKRCVVHRYEQRSSDDDLIFWYVIWSNNNSSAYYYSSPTQVTDFSRTSFVYYSEGKAPPVKTEDLSEEEVTVEDTELDLADDFSDAVTSDESVDSGDIGGDGTDGGDAGSGGDGGGDGGGGDGGGGDGGGGDGGGGDGGGGGGE